MWFIAMLLFLALAVVLVVVKPLEAEKAQPAEIKQTDDGLEEVPARPAGRRRLPLWAPAMPLVIALILGFFAFTTRIGTKEVGVVTTFGQISRCDLGPGIHFRWPWQKITQLDGTIITDKFVGGSAIRTRINDGSTADVSATIRWRIDPEQACQLYQDYRSDNVDKTIADALVRTQFTAAVASVFSHFDPLLAIRGKEPPTATATSAGINLDRYSENLTHAMLQHLAEASPVRGPHGRPVPEIQVVSVTVSYLKLSDTTQNRLNDYQAEVARTRIAQQAEQTAIAQAAANRKLAASVSNDPNVLVSRCLDIWQEIVEAGGTPPVGTSCWPGSNSGVLVTPPGTK